MVLPGVLSHPAEPRGPVLSVAGAWNEDGWSPDGRCVIFGEQRPGTGWDIGIRPTDGGEPRWFLATPFGECCGAVSPDGRWMAYVSREAGDYDVY